MRRARAKERAKRGQRPRKKVLGKHAEIHTGPQPSTTIDNISGRRGERYTEFCETGLPEAIARGEITREDAAESFGTKPTNITRMFIAWKEDLAIERARHNWEPPEEAKAAREDFNLFRARYFKVPDNEGHVLRGKPYDTPEFQQHWIDETLKTIAEGAKLQILAPPRHGKSELLAHFCIWLIVRNPNVRLLWVGLSEDIAKQSLGQVKDELENNELLIADFCGPGSTFRPTMRSGLPWRVDVFTVGIRTITGIKSPTLRAIGKGGRILSRDADGVIVDDIVDHASTRQESTRKSDSTWFRTQLMSRLEPHTWVMMIGSRQHPQDIYGENQRKSGWKHIVDTAHDQAKCQGEPHERCVLFPDLRPYDWLMQQRDELEDMFDMVYLNKPRAEHGAIFVAEHLHACRNEFRGLGLAGLPSQVRQRLRLVAGMDPAASGYQASFLWGVDVKERTRYMLDLRNDLGGGIQGAREIVKEWRETYQLTLWVVETNSQQTAWVRDEQLMEYCAQNGILVHPHHTGKNKWDEHMGVSALAGLFRERAIDMPYGDIEAIKKTDLFVGTCLDWTGEPKPHWRRRSDLLMAAWFPSDTIRKWLNAAEEDVAVNYGLLGEPTEYPDEWAMDMEPRVDRKEIEDMILQGAV